MSLPSVGRYRVDGRIAVGGMGEVYRATIESVGGVGKTVALKVIRPELAADPRFAALFVEEAKVAMSLSHANVVQSFDVGRIDERWFIAMELVDGVDLAELLSRTKQKWDQPIPQRHAILIAVEALKGLDYSHRRRDSAGEPLRIVHRDVSPSNLLVSFEGEVKVADFGIAKSTMRQVGSHPGKVAGKLPYMAPEQLRSSAVDARTDIYSMGAVLYHMATGQTPFRAAIDTGSIPAILSGQLRRPRDVLPDVPQGLEAIILRAMATEPAARYPSAAAMRQELEALAMASSYLLSTSDLADFVRELEAAGPADPVLHAEDSSDEPSRSVAVEDEAEPADPFDAILGNALVRVATDEAFSVWVTRPELPRTPAGAGTVPPSTAPPSQSRGRRRWLLGAALLALIPVAWLAAPAIAPERSTGEPPAPSSAPEESRSSPPAGDASVTPVTDAGHPPPPITRDSEPPARDAGVVRAALSDAGSAARRPRRRRAPRATPSPGGFLSANTEPWSYLYIDGRRVRATPVLRHPISAGRHELRFQNPARGLERRITVTVEPGEHERVTLDL